MQNLLIFSQQTYKHNAIFNDQSFNDTLTNDIVSFEQLGPELKKPLVEQRRKHISRHVE